MNGVGFGFGFGFGNNLHTQGGLLNVLPVLTDIAVSTITDTTCLSAGEVDPKGYSTVVTLEWGTDGINFPNSVSIGTFAVVGTWSLVPITGLPQNTSIHYMVKATSIRGEVYSDIGIFTTTNIRLVVPLTYTGTGLAVTTLRIQVSEDISATLDGTAKFYTDAAGTLGESDTWNITSGALRTIYLKVPSGTANLIFTKRSAILCFGDFSADGWTSGNNAAKITGLNLSNLSSLLQIRITGQAELSGLLPLAVIIRFDGVGVNYTNNDFTGTSNINTLNLNNWRTIKITSAEMLTILSTLTNRVGTLPATITINDYADYASPPQSVTDAVNLLKSTKSVTTVNLGA